MSDIFFGILITHHTILPILRDVRVNNDETFFSRNIKLIEAGSTFVLTVESNH